MQDINCIGLKKTLNMDAYKSAVPLRRALCTSFLISLVCGQAHLAKTFISESSNRHLKEEKRTYY